MYIYICIFLNNTNTNNFLLRIWKEQEISRQKWLVEKWFLWTWKGKKLRSNVWETTRCPLFELSWFFGVNKRSRCFTKVDEMVRSKDLQVNFQGDLKVKTIFLRLNSVDCYHNTLPNTPRQLPRNNGMDVVSSVSFGVLSCREFPLPLTIATSVTISHGVTNHREVTWSRLSLLYSHSLYILFEMVVTVWVCLGGCCDNNPQSSILEKSSWPSSHLENSPEGHDGQGDVHLNISSTFVLFFRHLTSIFYLSKVTKTVFPQVIFDMKFPALFKSAVKNRGSHLKKGSYLHLTLKIDLKVIIDDTVKCPPRSWSTLS